MTNAIRNLAVALLFSAIASPLIAQQTDTGAAYKVLPGDILQVSVWKEEEMQLEVLVRPDSAFSFPLAGEISTKGKSVVELQEELTARLARYISNPVVTVSVKDVLGNKIYVIGQVNDPGEFVVNPRVDVMQALSMAGGLTAFANTDAIKILRRDETGQRALSFDYGDVLKGRSLDQNILLQAGDIVVVP